MLPFPILNHYGNTVQKNQIKKIVSSDIVVALLYSNGNLYMRGSNGYNNFGITSPTDYLNWVLVRTNVQDVWVSSWTTIVQDYSGSYFCAGYGRSLGYAPTSNLWTAYDKISTLLTSTSSTVKSIVTGRQGSFIILNNNNLYAIGFNASYCLGLPTLNSTITTFTLSRSAVREVAYTISTSICIGTNNIAYAVGDGTNYKLGTGSSSTSTSWTALTLPTGYTYPIKVNTSIYGSFIYAADTSSLGSTSLLYSGAGTGNSGGFVPDIGNSTTFNISASGKGGAFTSFGTGYNSAVQSFYMDNTHLYSAGVAGTAIGSSTNKSTGFTAMALPSSTAGLNSFCVVGDNNSGQATFIVQNNIIYACGDASWIGTASYNFVSQLAPE